MLERDDIAPLIPHQGTMCLLDRVIEWDKDSILLGTVTHRSPTNPLRLDGRLRSIHLCEYGAQAMAVHGGLSAQADGRTAHPGFLVSLRNVLLHTDFIETLDGELRVSARRLMGTGNSWQYSFEVEHEGRALASGRAAVIVRSG